MEFMEAHLAKHKWFSGEHITLADFQMSFAVEAVLSRTQGTEKHPHLV
jgi:glutathione S-transferase